MGNSTTSLAGKVALVTGGSRGIGASVVRELALRGAAVAFTGTTQASADAGRHSIGLAEARLLPIGVDVRDQAQVIAAIDRTVAELGGLDILVNNAGVGYFAPVAETSAEEWRRVIDTNLTGVYYCCHAAIPHLKKRGGWIINVSSLAGKNTFARGGVYCASKWGLNALSEVLMEELRQDGIRVAYVMPGSVATEFNGRPPGPEDDWKLSPDDVAQVVTDLLEHPSRSLPSRVEIRPSRPARSKG